MILCFGLITMINRGLYSQYHIELTYADIVGIKQATSPVFYIFILFFIPSFFSIFFFLSFFPLLFLFFFSISLPFSLFLSHPSSLPPTPHPSTLSLSPPLSFFLSLSHPQQPSKLIYCSTEDFKPEFISLDLNIYHSVGC